MMFVDGQCDQRAVDGSVVLLVGSRMNGGL